MIDVPSIHNIPKVYGLLSEESDSPVSLQHSYWPPIPNEVTALETIAISHIVSRSCGVDVGLTYLIEAIAAVDGKYDRHFGFSQRR
jgi:hypothetical protein